MSAILVVCEQENGKLKNYSAELCGVACGLAGAMSAVPTAVVVNASAEITNAIAVTGVKRVINITAPELAKFYNSDGYTAALAQTIAATKPTVVLGSATPFGKDCVARAAMRLKVGCAPDAVAIAWKDNGLLVRHPVYAGKALVDIYLSGSPQFALARPNAFGGAPAATAAAAEVVTQTVTLPALRAQVKEVIAQEQTEVDLTEANMIVAGGRALGSSENFKFIRDLAKVMHASVGASRAAVDAGYISHHHQVGQTGKTVNPTLYIACGISGAIQHLAGMRTSRFIVAINKDPDAPIFAKADFGIVGDLFAILPVLTEKMQKALAA